ncbi:O-antigen ligase family protein [Terracidiphilus sp.]|jgi:hypothetical protein|uniref:O-antigen ligase family protein n=1 Tax=Terracidiphilus sp. TaxID=1964191 RepID=UPI003C253234
MGAPLALLICGVFVAGLFFLDRDKSVRVSKVSWLPVLWLCIIGSRPVSTWFGMSGPSSGDVLASTLDGSPMDAAIYEALIVAGIVVLARRGKRTNTLLKASGPVLLYFAYCLLSTLWSPFHEPSFKRWIKCVGDLIMVLIIFTDVDPAATLRRIFSRVGFFLFPLSIVLIRWTDMGRTYDPSGVPMNTGVTTNKNTLGLILYVISIGVAWNLRTLLLNRKAPNRTRRMIAQGVLLLLGVWLLQMAHSATSTFCFFLGSFLMYASGLSVIRKRPANLHVLCLSILLLGAGAMLFGGESVTSAMGRSSDFSGRGPIWAAAIASADNPLIGTGFESFWNANAHKVAHILSDYHDVSNLNSAHDGYLQIYLDLGWAGVCLILTIVFGGYFRAVRAFQRDRELGCLILAFIVTCAFYNITEAGFRIMTPSWISLLLGVIGATGITIGLVRPEQRKSRISGASTTRGSAAIGKPISAGTPLAQVSTR